MTNKLLEYPVGTKMVIMSPVVHGEKGTHKEVLEKLMKYDIDSLTERVIDIFKKK